MINPIHTLAMLFQSRLPLAAFLTSSFFQLDEVASKNAGTFMNVCATLSASAMQATDRGEGRLAKQYYKY